MVRPLYGMMEIAFITLIFLSGYSYLLYPVILLILSRLARHPWNRDDFKPFISMIVSAYNEEAVIEEKLRNALVSNYPEEHLEIIVSSDGSTDRTNEIVTGIGDPRVVLRSFSRIGKAACLNRIVPGVKGDIVVFTDANSMFPGDLLLKLSRNFSDPCIGLVTGWTRYLDSKGEEEATSLYSRFEKWTKKRESQVSSCVGADGAVFAVRKELYRSLQDQDINDFIIPLIVIRQHKRAVLDEDVVCFERASEGTGKEYRRQVRITTRTLGAIRRNSAFLNPLRFGSFSFFLWSHKVMRFLVPFFLIGLFLANVFVAGEHTVYMTMLICQILFLLLGIYGMLGRWKGRASELSRFLVLTFYAQVVGMIRSMRGMKDTTWTPER